MAPSILDRRSNRLARALMDLGVGPGDRLAVSCCQEHSGDAEVALAAARKVGANPALVPPPGLADLLASLHPRLLLACSEGVSAWRTSGVPCAVVGDDPGVTWWKLVEARQSPEPFALVS